MMRDWRRELSPGTLLCGKFDHVFALVLHVSVQYMPNWTQLRVLVLTSKCKVVEANMEAANFFDSWLKVET